MSADEMLRELWKSHYHPDKGVMMRPPRVEHQQKRAAWFFKTGLGAGIFAAIVWGWGKAFG